MKRCYIYTRVSTAMQTEGYSLAAQEERLRRYAEYNELEVIDPIYEDGGKSGKSLVGRESFLRMLEDIEAEKDSVDYVLVLKLSRFGRNAADVLYSLQRMQDYGVNLICVEDGIDSSKGVGKLMISVVSAVAEIERENIVAQTQAGREQKALEGGWNGGIAPYGYGIEDGALTIVEKEAVVVRLIYDKYVHTSMGLSGVARYLYDTGVKKIARKNGKLEYFSTHMVKNMLDNPIYMGKIAYGRRRIEKVKGDRGAYRVVKQDEYLLSDGKHEGLVTDELWHLAQSKRKKTGIKRIKTYDDTHANILSGLVKCPICGESLYGNSGRKKRPNGGYYKPYFFYQCKRRKRLDGYERCTYHKQWQQHVIDDAVAEVILKLVSNPHFEEAIKKKIGRAVDTSELDVEIANRGKTLKALVQSKNRIVEQIDALGLLEDYSLMKYDDLQNRLDGFYEKIEEQERVIDELKQRVQSINQQRITTDNIYQLLILFDKVYEKFNALEKKEFMQSMIERVDIFEDVQLDGRILKGIEFKFPIIPSSEGEDGVYWDNKLWVETVCLFNQAKTD